MKLIKTAFTKIKDYFTANQGRKIFFYGLVAAIFGVILYLIEPSLVVRKGMLVALVVAGGGTLWDSMYTRYQFLKKVRDIQYEHLKEIYDKQAAGENVVMTATFSDEESRYLRRRKIEFVLIIIFKTGLVIALFSLLLAM